MPMRSRFKPLSLLLFAVIAFALAGCYLPVRFDAEIEIDRKGYYSMIFDGYMVWVPLYEDIRSGKLSPDQEKAKVERIKTDITRDSAATEFKYIKKGHFKLHWEKKGDLLRTKAVTFLRRNERIFSLKYVKQTGRITVEGRQISKENIAKLAQAGLSTQGELRVITNAGVLDHNANEVRKGKGPHQGKKIYVWKVTGFQDPKPKLIIPIL